MRQKNEKKDNTKKTSVARRRKTEKRSSSRQRSEEEFRQVYMTRSRKNLEAKKQESQEDARTAHSAKTVIGREQSKKTKKRLRDTTEEISAPSGKTIATRTEDRDEPKSITRKAGNKSDPSTVDGVCVDNRLLWTNRFLDSNPKAKNLCREFHKAKWDVDRNTYNVCDANPNKNQYAEMKCIDATRVILKDRPANNDFIHASWIKMPDKTKYICTQGPKDNTIEDFWHMVWTEKVELVVMLCSFTEGGHKKCGEYFPLKDETFSFGPYKVTRKSTKNSGLENVQYRILSVKKESVGTPILIHHFAHLAWKDHLVPSNPTEVVSLLRMAKTKMNNSPMIVHCSAGAGRSMSFIAIEYINQRTKKDSNVKILDIVKELRTMRYKSIQTYVQYAFVIICVLDLFCQEHIVNEQDKRIKNLNDDYRDYMRKKKVLP